MTIISIKQILPADMDVRKRECLASFA